MEMSLMILFLLVRDSRGRAMCLGQACFMVMSLGLTAVYHHILARTFDPLIAFCPHDPGRKLQTPAPVDFNASRLQTLDRTYVINLPLDPDGRVHHTAADIRRSVGVPVSDKDATMNAAGRIKLNK